MKKVVLFLAIAMMFANTDICSAQSSDPIETFKALAEQVKERNNNWKLKAQAQAKSESEVACSDAGEVVEEVEEESVAPLSYSVPNAGEAEEVVFKANHNNKFNFEVGNWKTELDGHLQIADDNDEFIDINRRIDFGKDINFSKEKIPSFKLTYKMGGRTTMELSYLKQKQDGHLSIDGKVFNGQVFQAGAYLEVENEWYDVAWTRKLARTLNSEGNETSSAGFIFGVKTNKAYAAVKDPEVAAVAVAASKDWDKTIPVPYLGLNGSIAFGNRLHVKGDFRYFKLDYDKYEAEYHDYIIEAAYRLTGDDCKQEVFLKGGYRNAEYDVSGKGDAILLEYKGPVVSLEFLF